MLLLLLEIWVFNAFFVKFIEIMCGKVEVNTFAPLLSLIYLVALLRFFLLLLFFNLTIFLKRKSDCIRLYFDGTFRFQRNLCALWRSLSMLILFISSFFLLWWWWFLLIYFCLFIYFLIAKLYENVLWKQSIYVVLYCLTNFILFGMYIQTSAISEKCSKLQRTYLIKANA